VKEMQLESFDNTMMILDTLTREQSSPTSINELTKQIEARYGRAYYHSIYTKIQYLEKNGMISLERIGKSTIPKLNLQNYFLLDSLTLLEINKKQRFLKKYPELRLPLISIQEDCKNLHYIKSISLIDAERNKRLNRMELLILLKDADHDGEHSRKEIRTINRFTHDLQNKYNIKIDSLIIDSTEFHELAGAEEVNPLREMLSETITFFSPENYWMEIKKMQSKGIQIRISDKEIIPSQISEKELTYNLTKFGYREFGYAIQASIDICIEYIITAILQNNDIRRIEAIPIILAKNDQIINYRILIFLCQKYKLLGELLDLLWKLDELKSTEKTKEAIAILDYIGIEPKEAIDKATIMEKMKLYNAF
jgi:hypothetical protein